MNLQQLKAVCAVAHNGLSVSAAADRLHTSQPAVSKQIRSFEVEMGAALFVRSKGRLTALTDVGQRVLSVARSTLDGVSEIRAICGSQAAGTPTRLVVAASVSRAKTFFPDVLHSFKAHYPDIEVALLHGTLSEMIESLLNGTAALAISIESRPLPAGIASLAFGEIPRILAVPADHPLTLCRRLSFEAIAQHPMVLYDEGYAIRDEVLSAFSGAKVALRVSMTASGSEVVKAYVARGLGISVLAASSFDPQSDTRLRALDVDHLFPRAVSRILIRRGRFLRNHELDFIGLCAPGWSKQHIRRMTQGVLLNVR